MSLRFTVREIALCLALLPYFGVPIVSVIAWHSIDAEIPNDDAGQFATTAAEMSRSLSDGGPLAFLKSLYLTRGTRPVSLPCFAAIFLSIAGNDLKIAASLTLCCFYILLQFYSFQLLRLSTTITAAAIGSATVTTLPWIVRGSEMFIADIPMVAMMVAAAYHAQRCRNWTSLPHSVALGVALAVAISLRPIEPLPAACTLLAIMFAINFRSKRVGLLDLSLALHPAFVLLTLFLLRMFSILQSPGLTDLLLCAAVAGYALVVIRSGSPLNRCFAATVGTLVLGVGLWYLPFTKETWNWAWSCSFGDMSRLYSGISKLELIPAVSLLFKSLGGIQLALIGALAGMALVASACTRRFAFPGALILGAGSIQVLLVAIANSTDMRRGYIGFYWAFLGLTIYATAPSFRWHGLRTAVLSVFTAVQLAVVCFSAVGPIPVALRMASKAIRTAYPPPRTWPDKSSRTFDEVVKHVPPKCDIAAMTVAIYAHDKRVFDLSALGAVSSIRKSSRHFGCPCIFETAADGYRQLRDYHFVLLDTRPILSEIPEHRRREPYSMLSEDLALRYQQNRLAEVGLKEKSAFDIDNVKVAILEWISATASE